jgi:hypothetical protein
MKVRIVYRGAEEILEWRGSEERLGELTGGCWDRSRPEAGTVYDITSPRFQEGYAQMRGWINDASKLRLVPIDGVVLEV